MELWEQADAVAERVLNASDRAYVRSIIEGALAAAIDQANTAHVKISQDGAQIRIDIDKTLRPDQALMLMAQAIELVRVRTTLENLHTQRGQIILPNGAGGTHGGDVQFRLGKVGDK